MITIWWTKDGIGKGCVMSFPGDSIDSLIHEKLPGFLHIPAPWSQKPAIVNSKEIAIIQIE